MKKYLENLAISKKFSVLLVGTALLVTAILVVLYSAISSGLKAKKMADNLSGYINVLNDLHLSLDEIHGGLLISLINQKEISKEAKALPQGYWDSRKKLLALTDQINEKTKLVMLPDSLKGNVANITVLMKKAVAYSDSYVNLLAREQTEVNDSLYSVAYTSVFEQFIPVYANLSTSIGELKKANLELQLSTTKKDDAAVIVGAMLMLCSFLIGVTFIFVYARLLGNVTSQAVKQTQEILEALSLGEIPVVQPSLAKDEFGAMQNGLKKLVTNLDAVKNFISKIGRGEFDIQEEVFENKGDLSNALWKMRDSLSQIKQEEQKARWTNDGLTQFAELVRTYQHSVEDLANKSIRFLCRYINAQQGSFFIHQKTNSEEYLTLIACFAFDKKKYREKQILIGDGVLGQAFLEAGTVLMTDIPQGYLHITSGLGDANPTCLAIIPLKYNGVMEGIIELATFHKIESYQLRFLERCGETLASALQMATISANTNRLLQQSQQHGEEMRAQEEEMRQNMEEMASTQEELQRREKIQKDEIAHLNKLHEQNMAASKRLSLVADNTDNSVVITDAEGKIEYVNKGFINLTGYTLQEVIGKKPGSFLQGKGTDAHTVERIRQNLKDHKAHYEEILNYDKAGREYWISLAINPIIENGAVTNYISIQTNVTKTKLQAIDFTMQLEAIGKSNAVIEFDLNGTINHANEKFLQIMGYRLEEITGKHHGMFVRDEDLKSNEYKKMWEDLGDGKSTTGLFRRKNNRGDEVWLNGTYTSIVDLNGKPYRVIKFAQDVTEQLVKSMDVEGQANAIDHAMDSVEFTKEGNIVHANSRFLETIGYTLEEIKGKHHSIFIDEVYAKSIEYKKFWEDLGNGLPQSGEFQRIGKDEKIVWLSASYTPVKNVSGKVYKVIKLAQNITKQKMEAIDFESQRQAIDKAYSVVEFDPEGKILHANDNFLQLMGYELRDIKGRHHRIFTQLDESHSADYREFWKMLSEGEFIEGKFSRVTKAGKVIQIQGTYFGVKNLSGKIFKVVKFAQQIDNNDRARAGDKPKLTVI